MSLHPEIESKTECFNVSQVPSKLDKIGAPCQLAKKGYLKGPDPFPEQTKVDERSFQLSSVKYSKRYYAMVKLDETSSTIELNPARITNS